MAGGRLGAGGRAAGPSGRYATGPGRLPGHGINSALACENKTDLVRTSPPFHWSTCPPARPRCGTQR